MTYPQIIQYLESFIDYEKIPAYPYKESLKLERISGFLKTIGNPHDGLKCLHIAGTKGKGSTCAFLTYILRQAGYKTGLYTSPHLSDFRERIRVLEPQSCAQNSPADFEGMISEQDMTGLILRLKPAIDDYNKNSQYGPLSFFEVYTALAFMHFKEHQADFVVLETGLGGRLDATNVCRPLACVITPISYEHTQKLGSTLQEIAGEKAGIIKQGSLVVSAPQDEDAQKVIRDTCLAQGAKLYEVGKDITFEENGSGFSVRGVLGEYPDLNINLIGRHQRVNATAAVGAIEALRAHNIQIEAGVIRDGLKNSVWPGRLEVISRRPLVVLDGAQNIASAGALKKAIKEKFRYEKLILVLGVSSDKDIRGICSQLKDLASEVILTCADNPRATRPSVLAGYFLGKTTHTTANIREAKALARYLAKENDLVLVTGSLFVVGEFRNVKA